MEKHSAESQKENNPKTGGENTQKFTEEIKALEKEVSSTSTNETILQFKNYERVTSKGKVLLKRVSFSIPKGKVTALLGLSGDGKTRLLESMAGQCTPGHKTYGEVYVQNTKGVLQKRDAVDWFSKVNYIEQGMTDYKNMPAYAMLCSIAKCFGKTESEVEDHMAVFRISKVKEVPFKRLSGGEQRRAMVIAGMLSNKEFNIWDEPLTGLDSEIARVVLSTIKKLNATNIVTVHQASKDLLKYFDHIILMHRSTIVYSGPAEKLKEYFTEKGIEFPQDVFYINYLMQLCAENSENHIDTKNIEIFNELTNSILHSTLGPEGPENIYFLPSQAKITFSHVVEILKRVFYFDKGFKGSAMLTDIFVPLLLVTLNMLGTPLGLLKGIDKKCETIRRYDNLGSLVWAYRVDFIKKELEAELKSDAVLRTTRDTLINYLANVGWTNYLLTIFQITILTISVVLLVFPSCFLNPHFYKLAKSNINSRQVTVGDYMASQTISIFVSKSLVTWVIQVSLYWFVYFSIDSHIRQYITTSHLAAMAVLFGSSVVLGLHSLMLNFSPVSLKLFSFLGLLYAAIIVFIPQIMIMATYGNVKSILQYLPLFRNDIPLDDNLLIALLGDLELLKGKFMRTILRGLVVVIKFLAVSSPTLYFQQLLIKIGIYFNYFQLDPAHINKIDVSKIAILQDKINSILDAEETAKGISMGKNLAEMNSLSVFAQHIRGEITPHEVFSKDISLKGISVGHIILSRVRFWIVPVVLLFCTGFYTYKHLQPKLRN